MSEADEYAFIGDLDELVYAAPLGGPPFEDGLVVLQDEEGGGDSCGDEDKECEDL